GSPEPPPPPPGLPTGQNAPRPRQVRQPPPWDQERRHGARHRGLALDRQARGPGRPAAAERRDLGRAHRPRPGPLAGPQRPHPHGCLKEGDTPSWLYFLPTGLSDPAHPDWGGWGGRFRRAGRGLFRDAADTVGKVTDARATVWRWRPAFQADFAARMAWCVKPVRGANHPPVAVLNGD